MNEFWDNIGLGPIIPFLQIASVLITAYFIFKIFWYLTETKWLESKIRGARENVSHKKLSKDSSSKAWREILAHAKEGGDRGKKLALIEADSMLNNSLLAAGMFGADLGERLAKANRSTLPNLQDVWDAHKLRNRIAHEPGFVLEKDQFEKSLHAYEEAFRHFGLID